VNIKQFVAQVTGVALTETTAATVIQTRHRIPEDPLGEDQILVLQVPIPEPLRTVEPSEQETRRMHAEADYGRMWLRLYEDIVHFKEITIGSRYPVRVNGRHIMDPSPIPRWDNPKLNMAEGLFLFGAGREKRIYAIPPHTQVESLEFEDFPFRVESFDGKACRLCGSAHSYLDEIIDDALGERAYQCSDTSYCAGRVEADLETSGPDIDAVSTKTS
jgi:alpha-D-ribose 1-methylphosphonate 5-phosphate C-P lyase